MCGEDWTSVIHGVLQVSYDDVHGSLYSVQILEVSVQLGYAVKLGLCSTQCPKGRCRGMTVGTGLQRKKINHGDYSAHYK